MKAKKLSKVILAFALSAAMLIEPVAGIPTVHAQETQPSDLPTEEKQNSEETPINSQEGDDSEQDASRSEVENGSEEESGSRAEDGSEEEKGSGAEDGSEEESGSGAEDGSEEESGNGAEDGPEEENGTEAEDGSEEENDEQTEEESVLGEETEGTGDKNVLEEEAEDESKLEGFSLLPSGYELNSSQKKLKKGLSSLLDHIDESDEGGTYAARRVYTFADSREAAEMIAEAYHAEIISFDMGVLTLKLGEDKTVKQALKAAADMDNNLPPVWPDYRNELFEEVIPEMDVSTSEIEIMEEEYVIEDTSDMEMDSEEMPSLAEYEQVLNELNGFGDEFLNPASDSYQWFHTTIGSPYAWDAGYMGDGIKVGVVDSGVDVNSDLEANIIDRKDFCDGTTTAYDDEDETEKHGTHVAGIIAATANNSQGVGVAPKAKIYNAKVFGKDEAKSGYDSTIMAALLYLISEENNSDLDSTNSVPAKVDIINMSLGGPAKNFAWDPSEGKVYSPYQLILNKAYKKGVAVFVATGNDGGSLAMYPASYDHVIGVAATDTNNQRAYFSNYGISTDLAAPGVNIYSTRGSGYASLQGTSMACPVAAGEAAVILSGAADLATLNGKTGKDRVDALTKIMQGNTISAGSGMGKGITNLPKVFKLSTAAAKPSAPMITSAVSADKQSVEITIKVQSGMSLCYTTNGKNPVYKNEETDANTTYVDSTELTNSQMTLSIDCTQNANGTVKAFAINASGVIGPVKSVTYKLSPYIKTIAISGPAKVEAGKSIQLTAEITPTYAANKNLVWTIVNSNGAAVDTAKIKIDSKKGKITATASADLGTYEVTATAQDAQHTTGKFEIEVVKAGTAIQSLTFAKSANKELWLTKTGAESRDLTLDLTVKEKNEAGVLVDVDNGALVGRVVWTSSKPAVATVNYSTGKITAQSVGTTTITAKANDSGNKKATINITVKQAVEGIEITTDKGKTEGGLFAVAAGKNMTLKAALTPKKPSNSKVVWSISPEDSNVTINPSNGKITVKREASRGTYTVTATAADGKGAAATRIIEVYSGAIGQINLDSTKETLYTKYISAEKTNTKTIYATIKGANGSSDFNPNAYMVTSSNEAIVTATSTSSSEGVVAITITATGAMYGKASIVVMATDGSNKKATCAVTVSGGITKVELQDASGKKVSKMTLFRNGTTASAPKTAELAAVISGSEGANISAYDVTSSNPKLVKAALNRTNGKITLVTGAKSTGKATITLMATDGSKKKATCTVTVSNPPSRINVAPKGGETGCVVPGKSVQFTATMETENGALSGKKVVWSFAEEEAEALAALGIKINASSGKITVPKTVRSAQGTIDVNKVLKSWGTTAATVCATAKDGSGVQGKADFYLAPATTYIQCAEPYQDPNTGVLLIEFTSDCFLDITCSSSSPKVASPTIVYKPRRADGSGGSGYIKFVGNTSGTVSFTLKAIDGSGKQVKTMKIRFR